MTVAELIESVLRAIARDFYRDRLPEFQRDRRALTMAIARYGVECRSRAWEFHADEIRVELLKLLNSMLAKRADIKYLPSYLEGAVDRHIRLRAEELSAAGKRGRNIVAGALAGLKPAAIREATPVETLAALYKDQQRIRAAQRAQKKIANKLAAGQKPQQSTFFAGQKTFL